MGEGPSHMAPCKCKVPQETDNLHKWMCGGWGGVPACSKTLTWVFQPTTVWGKGALTWEEHWRTQEDSTWKYRDFISLNSSVVGLPWRKKRRNEGKKEGKYFSKGETVHCHTCLGRRLRCKHSLTKCSCRTIRPLFIFWGSTFSLFFGCMSVHFLALKKKNTIT